MSNNFFGAIKKLMPDSYRTSMHVDSNVRKLFEAIAVLPDDMRKELQGVYMDFFADVTRGLDDWERVFGVLFTLRELELRRKILAALWKMNGGGQSWEFLQMVLRLVVPEISVVENVPVRDPRPDGVRLGFVCGGEISCGNKDAICGFLIGKGKFVRDYKARCGDDETLCGFKSACCGFKTAYGSLPEILMNNRGRYYTDISPDSWAYYFFVCKNVYRDARHRIAVIENIQIPDIYKNFVEYFILKIKPVHSRAVMYVEWV